MKKHLNKISVVLIFFFLSAFIQKESSDCTFYFPQNEGDEFEMTSYNAKGKEQSIYKHKILEKVVNGGNVELKSQFEVYDPGKDEKKTTGKYTALCEDGVFKIQMGGISTAGMQEMKGFEMKINSDNLEIPANPTVGQSLSGGEMHITMVTETGDELPLFKMSAVVSNRKVEALEKRTTPAGTFDCVKISYEVETKMLFKINANAVEWYAKGVGLVRSETYNKIIKKYVNLTA